MNLLYRPLYVLYGPMYILYGPMFIDLRIFRLNLLFYFWKVRVYKIQS